MQRALALLLLPITLLAQEPSKVALKASDGQPLIASHFAPSLEEGAEAKGGVLLLHMYRSSRRAWDRLARPLAARGFHVLALDMRGHGDSLLGADGKPVNVGRSALGDPKTNPFLAMEKDARAGLDYLVKAGAPEDRLGIAGASVGCSIALHAAALYPKLVASVALLSPGTNYLGVPSLDHAKKYGKRPLFILSSKEEAARGAEPLKELLPAATLRLIDQRSIHGTQMLGRVPGIEAELVSWFEDSLRRTKTLAIPYDPNVLLDGSLGKTEALSALNIPFPLGEDGEAMLRLCVTKYQLTIACRAPERLMRRNAFVVYLCDPEAGVPTIPNEHCLRVTFSPALGPDERLAVAKGEDGKWVPLERPRGVLAYANSRERDRWSAEIGLSRKRTLAGKTQLAMGFQLDGAVEGKRRFHPAVESLPDNPRNWLLFSLQSKR